MVPSLVEAHRRLLSAAGALTVLVLAGLVPAPRSAARAADPPPTAPRPAFGEPALSPDGSEIAFVSGGDIWTVPAAGGTARLLVSHPANDSRPVYAPDGRSLAFVSTRSGAPDVYVLSFETGALRRLTFDDAAEDLDGFSRDGRWLYFSSASHEISRMGDVYRVSVEGGTPMTVTADRYLNESASAPSPDGRTLAFVARGFPQWWRRGRSHIDETEIWLRHDGAPARFERVTAGGARDLWPMWAPDGRSLYFVSDRDGAPNVFVLPLGGAPRALTAFRDGRVVWPSLSADGTRLAFERGFGVWTLDTATGRTAEVPITLFGAAAGRATEHLALTGRFSDLALSPDGKKVAFVARGEIFAASAKDGGDALRVTRTAAAESAPVWSPDSRRLVYVSEREGSARLFAYDFAKGTESALGAGGGDVAPRFSPDGKRVAFVRAGRELRVVEVATGRETLLATGHFDRQPLVAARPVEWSPDGRYVAFLGRDERRFDNVAVVPASGGAARQVSFLANAGANAISWSPDGTFLLFDTGQRMESGQLARVDLVPHVPRLREDQFRDLFREEPPPGLSPDRRPRPGTAEASPSPAPSPAGRPAAARPSPTPVEIAFEGLRQRLRLLPVGVDAGYHAISPDGLSVVMIASTAGQPNLWVYSLDELSREAPVARQITSTPGGKADAAFSPDGKEVFYLDDGKVMVAPLDGKPRALAVTAEMDVDFDLEKQAVFTQAWTYLRDHFHDPGFHGVDWVGVREAYAPRVAAARTPEELRRTLSLMVGELDASHLGVGAPPDDAATVTGRLAVSFDREEYERRGRLRVSEVVPLGPAAVAGLAVGDVITAVDGAPLEARQNLDERLDHHIGKRTVLTVAAGAGGASREVVARPVNAQTERGLRYRAWVESRRAYVEKASGGRLGYVHMFDMSQGALAQLAVDLDAENQAKDGVVVDVRNNNGGFVNVYAIDILARRSYLTMIPRDEPSGPARTMLGQRALERPTILVTNRDSLSDAEDFTEGYRALHLGKVVGEPTAGWILYTWNRPLVDGTILRLPRVTVRGAQGDVMEGHPRPVDVSVSPAVGDDALGRDVQLDTAVRELLQQIGPTGGTEPPTPPRP